MLVYQWVMMLDDVVSCVIMFNDCSSLTILRVQEEYVDIIKPSLPDRTQLPTQMFPQNMSTSPSIANSDGISKNPLGQMLLRDPRQPPGATIKLP